MRGERAYDLQNMKYIESIIKTNKDKPYLIGFSNFVSNLSSSTVYRYTEHAANFMKYANKNVADLTLDDYLGYMSILKDKTSSYQIAAYSALKKFSKYLAASGRNILDPMQHVSRPKFIESQTTKAKREIGYLETDEIKTFINAVKKGSGTKKSKYEKKMNVRDTAIVLILLNTGMRCSALWKLNVEDLDFENKRLVVTDKGSKVITYDISDGLIECIRKWLEVRETILNGINEDALFVSSQKTRLDQSVIRKTIKKYSSSIEGKNISPHKLRATFGTQVYKNTNDIYLTQMAMNHSSPKVTEMYIRGQSDKSKKVASDIMSKLTFGD